ncbi:Na+/H+ antiporter NhaC family protein [Legionella bozemanae]|uniref:H gluconate symporter n=1 Tax=Legionella bozemanae TaxID=447 RepID=A0A0W0RJZ4_LEGBO|nr:Na+/H+ antiporter NhaC family protein [Legionella bozemanae]KTC71349.1 H gluconate symporter [Legionella bozemanae]STO35425.1 H+/gluconate symporter and related permeases [Legionella bozemanae]
MSFYIQLASLAIIVLYVVMLFRNVDALIATALCVGLGYLWNLSSPIDIGNSMANALGSFMALVGFIIMLGHGLGEILTHTQVSHTLVHQIVYGIGINTQRRAKIGIVLSSFIIVGLLGTLAGGLAILAPSLRPIAGSVGLSRPSLAVLMQASAEEALILGPFAPPVVALLGITGLNYEAVLLYASLPVALVTLMTTWFMANRLQRTYAHESCEEEDTSEPFVPSKQQKRATLLFLISFMACVVYGLFAQAKTTYVIFVMLFLALITGLASKLSLNQIFKLLVEGMRKSLHLFFLFILFDPFMVLIHQAGGFSALTELLTPLINLGGKPVLSMLIGFTGAFGMPGAAEATIKMLHQLFYPSVLQMQLPMISFALCLVFATRVTNYAYPGANMFAAMGFAGSENVKAMIQNGLTVTAAQVLFLIVYSLFL